MQEIEKSDANTHPSFNKLKKAINKSEMDEARELKDVLDRTLGGGEKTIFVPSAPVIIERPWYPNYPHWIVTCDSTSYGDTTNR